MATTWRRLQHCVACLVTDNQNRKAVSTYDLQIYSRNQLKRVNPTCFFFHHRSVSVKGSMHINSWELNPKRKYSFGGLSFKPGISRASVLMCLAAFDCSVFSSEVCCLHQSAFHSLLPLLSVNQGQN